MKKLTPEQRIIQEWIRVFELEQCITPYMEEKLVNALTAHADNRYQIAREVIEDAVEAISKQKSFHWHKNNVYAIEVLDWLDHQQAEEEE